MKSTGTPLLLLAILVGFQPPVTAQEKAKPAANAKTTIEVKKAAASADRTVKQAEWKENQEPIPTPYQLSQLKSLTPDQQSKIQPVLDKYRIQSRQDEIQKTIKASKLPRGWRLVLRPNRPAGGPGEGAYGPGLGARTAETAPGGPAQTGPDGGRPAGGLPKLTAEQKTAAQKMLDTELEFRKQWRQAWSEIRPCISASQIEELKTLPRRRPPKGG